MKSVSQHVNPEKLHLAMIMLEADARAVEMRRFADCFNQTSLLRPLFLLGDTVTPAGHFNQCKCKSRKSNN